MSLIGFKFAELLLLLLAPPMTVSALTLPPTTLLILGKSFGSVTGTLRPSKGSYLVPE